MKVMNKVNDGHLEELLTFKQVIRRGCLEQCGEHAYRCQGVKGKEYPWRKTKKTKKSSCTFKVPISRYEDNRTSVLLCEKSLMITVFLSIMSLHYQQKYIFKTSQPLALFCCVNNS